MPDNPIPEPLREATWRRKPSPAVAARLRAWLAAHPEARTESEAEAVLNEALERLPDAPLSSNFTARVLEAVRLEAAKEQRKQKWKVWSWRPTWLARAAAAGVILGAGLLSFKHVQTTRKVDHFVKSMIAVSTPANVPSPEVLEDFDAIQRLNTRPAPDEELLSLMQ